MKKYDFLKIYKPLNEIVDDLELLGFLINNGFNTAKDILNMSESEILIISKNKLKAKKLKNIIKELSRITTFLENNYKSTYNLNNEFFLDYNLTEFYDLDNVSKTFLEKENIKTISDIYVLLDKFVTLPKIKRANIILKEIEKIKISELQEIQNEHNVFLDLWKSIFKIPPVIDKKIETLIMENNDVMFIEQQKVKIISLYIEYHLRKSNMLIKIDELDEIVKDFISLKDRIFEFLADKIYFINEFIKLKKPSIKEVYLIKRDSDEYSDLYNIVFNKKEDVPDITYYLNKFKLINKKNDISFDEEYFLYLNNTYDIKCNELEKYFYLDKMQIYYIDSFATSKGTRISLDKAINDELIPNDWKIKIKKIIFESRNYIDLSNGKYIKNNKKDIIEFVMVNYARDYTHIDEICDHFKKIVNESSLSNEIKEKTLKDLTTRDIEALLQRNENVILNLNKKYRYYSLARYNFNYFLEELNLDQYDNLVFSTNYFMKKHSKLMQDYDIRNEYDLHNVLKKLLENKFSKIKFGRMPIIKIGFIDEKAQILNFLKEIKKCKYNEFFEKYSERFGFHKASAISNYAKYLENYFSNGYYSIENGDTSTNINEYEFQKLKKELQKNFYSKKEFLEEAKKILNKDVLINQYLCNKIEFNELDNYLYKNFGTKSILGVIKYHIDNCEKFEIKSYLESLGFNKDYLKTSSFSLAITKLKRNFDIIKVENKNIFSSFNTIHKNTGVKKEEIIDFCKKAKEYANNRLLTYYELLESGFSHSLIKYNMGDTFYSYLIDLTNYSVKGEELEKEQPNETPKYSSNSKELLILLNFLTSWFIQNEEDPISIDVLKKNIHEQFSIEIHETFIIEMLSDFPFYYHNKFRLIFKDKNAYLEMVSE